MAISNKQKELDAYKWEKSQRLGFDACGSFDYCHHCDKSNENPCEMAYNRFSGVEVKIEEPVVEKTPAKKSTCTKSASKSTSKTTKSTSKKSTTKKSTSKSKTTKKSK